MSLCCKMSTGGDVTCSWMCFELRNRHTSLLHRPHFRTGGVCEQFLVQATQPICFLFSCAPVFKSSDSFLISQEGHKPVHSNHTLTVYVSAPVVTHKVRASTMAACVCVQPFRGFWCAPIAQCKAESAANSSRTTMISTSC